MKSLVSVIIPCYNAEKFIERAIRSVLTQTYQPIELLLVDNNSRDNTVTILKKFENEFSNIITVYSEKKKGACAARNFGLSKAKGNWIQFLDADDEILPCKITEQMSLADKLNPDIIADDYTILRLGNQEPYHVKVLGDDPWLSLINSKLGRTSANLWKKECLLKVNGWDEALSSSQEYNLMFRMLKVGAKVSITHQMNTLVHSQPDSITKTDDLKKLFNIYFNRYKLRNDIYDFLQKNDCLNINYRESLLNYLYYYLLLISEINMPFFKEHIKGHPFEEISFRTRVKLLVEFIRHSSKRKYGNSNLLLKGSEWNLFFLKNFYLLKY